MKILLYGLNYAPEITGVGKYSGQLGCWLYDQGHDVKVVTAPPYYPSWKISDKYRNWFHREIIAGVDIYRCPLYVPKHPSTVSRVLHLLSFSISSSCSLIRLIRWRPDIVINVVPALFTSFPALLYCRITGAKFVIHIQDFESDALFGLRTQSKVGVLEKIWKKIEKFVLTKADIVSTISYAMVDNAVAKGVDSSKTCYFPNWSEVTKFQGVKGVGVFKQTLLGDRKEKIVLYSGNIGRKQGFELVAECARMSQERNDNFLYVVCGEGAGKSDLLELKDRYKLNNMILFPLQPYAEFPRLLAMADVHLVVQAPNVANAVLPSKLTNIFAAGGNAVITTHEDTEIGRILEQNPGIAVPVKPKDANALLAGIELASETEKVNNVAVEYAKKHLSKESVLKQFEIKLIETVSIKG